jgi:hypothetical protein
VNKTIRIGGASGFWGDSMMAAPQLLAGGKLDYLVFDYLAEITMSIMARARAKSPNDGYATDFVAATMRQCLPEIALQKVKVISNAGGVNPAACAAALEALIAQLNLNLKVATVTGDDVMPLVAGLRERGTEEMFSGAPMPAEFMSANAYLGAFPIARALDHGADIVITGRGVDSAVTLGACIHAFGWKDTDYDRLAGGSLAGHIIECGAQATGGLFTDWQLSEGWENIGYPIAEVSADGSFIVGKPENTGGIVLPATVAEQMVYEIGDPQAYILPDVVCDFSQVHIERAGDNLVRVTNAKGAPPTDTYKVSATYQDGFRVGLYLTIAGIDADGKARKTADAILKRCRAMLRMRNMADFKETNVELIGAESGYGANRRVGALREVILKLAAKHDDPKALAMLLREATSSGTSMSPGTTGMGGNRPKPSPVVRLFSFLLPKSALSPRVHMGGETWDVPIATGTSFDPTKLARPEGPLAETQSHTSEVPLVALAWGRSGDKGNNANIGILAREPDYLPYIRAALTEDAVAQYFAHFLEGSVTRYDLPGVNGVNFVLENILGGGGMASLRNDPQGKTYAQMLLDFPVPVPDAIAARVRA